MRKQAGKPSHASDVQLPSTRCCDRSVPLASKLLTQRLMKQNSKVNICDGRNKARTRQAPAHRSTHCPRASVCTQRLKPLVVAGKPHLRCDANI